MEKDQNFYSMLNMWTERPQLEGKLNKRALKKHDDVIGRVIDDGNFHYKLKSQLIPYASSKILNFLDIWKYDGIIYRVINAKLDKIIYHNMISSWTKSIDAFESFNHLYDNTKYTFLIADTNGYFGFDVNKYRNYMDEENPYTGYEQEVIFPMNKAYIIDEFYGTLEEFKKHVKAT